MPWEKPCPSWTCRPSADLSGPKLKLQRPLRSEPHNKHHLSAAPGRKRGKGADYEVKMYPCPEAGRRIPIQGKGGWIQVYRRGVRMQSPLYTRLQVPSAQGCGTTTGTVTSALSERVNVGRLNHTNVTFYQDSLKFLLGLILDMECPLRSRPLLRSTPLRLSGMWKV